MNRERMEHLLKIMEDVQARRLPFDWSVIYREAENDEIAEIAPAKATIDYSDILNPKAAAPLAHFCGSAACVIGYAALDPEFNRAGLRVVNGHDGKPSHVGLGDGEAHYRGYEFVGMRFFDIEQDVAEYIFTGTSFVNDAQFEEEDQLDEAIRRIKNVLAGYRPDEEADADYESDPEDDEDE